MPKLNPQELAAKQSFRRAVKGIADCEEKNLSEIFDDLSLKVGYAASTIESYYKGKESLLSAQAKETLTKVIATEGVRRALLNEEWLTQWMRAMSYEEPAFLLQRLFPSSTGRGGSHHNFLKTDGLIRRFQAERVFRATQRSAYVVLFGSPGIGKSVLASQIGLEWWEKQCEHGTGVLGVWCSDRDQAGPLNLRKVLHKIAEVAEFPGYGLYEDERLRTEVEQLLVQRFCLLVIDEADERTKDDDLFSWLDDMTTRNATAGKLHVIVATRKLPTGDEISSIPIKIEPMGLEERRKFVYAQLEQMGFTTEHTAALEELIVNFEGHPIYLQRALQYVIGRGDTPIHQAVTEAIKNPERFSEDHWLLDIWRELEHPARQVLYATSLINSPISAAAVRAIAGVDEAKCSWVIDQLNNLALLEVYRSSIESDRYLSLRPFERQLIRRFLDEDRSALAAARKRQIQWSLQLIEESLAHFWTDLSKFRVLDTEIDVVDDTLTWCIEHGLWKPALDIAIILGYYYFLRGRWDDLIAVGNKRIIAAEHIDDDAAALSYAYSAQMLAKQQVLDKISTVIGKVLYYREIISQDGEPYFMCTHAIALWNIAKKQLSQAEELYRDYLSRKSTPRPSRTFASFWLAKVLHWQGYHEDALVLALEAYHLAKTASVQQTIVDGQVLLASIYLSLKQPEEMLDYLQRSSKLAEDVPLYTVQADISRIYGRYYASKRQWGDASEAFAEAADKYKRLGLDHEVLAVWHERDALVGLVGGRSPRT